MFLCYEKLVVYEAVRGNGCRKTGFKFHFRKPCSRNFFVEVYYIMCTGRNTFNK